jgi:hypothetical protein
MMRDAKGRFVKRPAPSVPLVRPSSSPPTFRSSWRYFALLIAAAITWHFAWPFVILLAIFATPFLLIWWLEPRYSFAAYLLARCVYGFMIGLIGSRRGYPRWWW